MTDKKQTKSKKSSKKAGKTATNANKNTNTQKVVVNVNSSTRAKTGKGIHTYTKGNSYMGGTPLRAVNYPSTTVINNMPSPTPMMMPQMDTNRLNALENHMQNISADIQGLYGKLNKPTPQEVSNVLPHLPPQTRDIATQHRQMIENKASQAKPDTRSMATKTDFDNGSSTASTPSFGGYSSSSGPSSGGDNPLGYDVSMQSIPFLPDVAPPSERMKSTITHGSSVDMPHEMSYEYTQPYVPTDSVVESNEVLGQLTRDPRGRRILPSPSQDTSGISTEAQSSKLTVKTQSYPMVSIKQESNDNDSPPSMNQHKSPKLSDTGSDILFSTSSDDALRYKIEKAIQKREKYLSIRDVKGDLPSQTKSKFDTNNLKLKKYYEKVFPNRTPPKNVVAYVVKDLQNYLTT